MENPQNSPNEIELIDKAIKKTKPFVLTIQQQYWIDYNALSGLITDITDDRVNERGDPLTMQKMTITKFAELLDVDRTTLRNWTRSIPDFWDRVNARRRELAPQARLQKVHEVWYLAAQSPKNFQDRQLWLANFDPNFRMPAQKVEHEMGNSWAALLESKRKVIESTNADTSD